MRWAILLLALCGACGPNARGGKVPIGLDSPEESPGDAVTSPSSPGVSPGVEPRKGR